MRYTVGIVEYNGTKGYYRRLGTNDTGNFEIAKTEALSLVRETGKCYGVFEFGNSTPVFETSNYYSSRKLKLKED